MSISLPGIGDPANLMALLGTLQQGNLVSPDEAAQARERDALRQQVEAARAAEQGAASQYAGAAAAPPPSVSPLEQSLTLGLGNIASLIAQGPEGRQHAHADLMAQQEAMLKARADNLTALRAIYEQRANAAERLGNTQLALENRQQMERLGKAWDQINQRLQGGRTLTGGIVGGEFGLERQREANEGALARALVMAAGGPGGQGGLNLEDYLQTSPSGYQYLNQAKIPTAKAKLVLTDLARRQHIPVGGDREESAIQLVNQGLTNIQQLREVVGALPATMAERNNPLNWAKREAAARLQGQSPYAEIAAQRESAITLGQGLAALGKGYRVNILGIQLALKNDVPTIHDTQEWATKKLDTREKLVREVERAALGYPPNIAEINRLVEVSKRLGALGGSQPATAASRVAPGAMNGAGREVLVIRQSDGRRWLIPADRVKDLPKGWRVASGR